MEQRNVEKNLHLHSKKMQAYLKKVEITAKANFTDDACDILDSLKQLDQMTKSEKIQLKEKSKNIFACHIEI